MRLEGRILKPIFTLGLSAFIMQASESIILVCFNSSLLKYGGDVAVGAMTILSSIMQFSNLPAQGLAQGAQPITSYNYGAGNADRVRKTFKILLCCTLGYTMVVWALVMAFPQMFAKIFVPQPELIDFTSWRYGSTVLAMGYLWCAGCLPDDLYFHWQRQGIDYGGCYAEVHPACAAYLHSATLGV